MRPPPLSRWPAAAVALVRLGLATRFRLGGRYWRWRMETAFGRGRPGVAELIGSALGYGEWVARMRPLMRAAAEGAPERCRLSLPSTGREALHKQHHRDRPRGSDA